MVARTIVIIVRLIVPVSIFRWPLAGGVVSMLIDGVDVILVDVLANLLGEEGGFGSSYQTMDKSLDIYYLSFELFVSLRWQLTLARNASIALFVYRMVGMVAFALTGARVLLFVFPNLFENFYLYYLTAVRYFPRLLPTTPRRLAVALLVLYIPKLGQEYVLHFAEIKPWSTFKSTFLASFLRR